MRKPLALTLTALLAVFAVTGSPATPAAAAGDNDATVTTDKTDYQPGETVIITGSGWAAGETVRLAVRRESSEAADANLSAVADEYGNILNREFTVGREHVGASFTLTATGQSSGRTATARFTDGFVMSYAAPTASLSYEASAAADQTSNVSVTVTGAPSLTSPCGGCNGRYDANASFVPAPGFPASVQVNPNPNSRNFRPSPPAQNSQSFNLVVKVLAGTPPGVYTGTFYAVPDAADPDVINAPGGAITKGAGTLVTVKVNNSAAPNSSATAVTLPDNAPYLHDTFTSKDVQVTLDATDLSGVADLKYQIDGGGYTTVTTLPAVTTITTEGTHVIQFFATDAFGLAESPAKTFIVKIDRTAPSFSGCGPADADWHGADVQFNCAAADNAGGSGLADPSDAAFTLSTNVPAGTEDANASTDSRQVCDAVGNCATAGPVAGNKVDRKAPTIDCGAADADWHATDVSIPCTATDGGAGLANASDASFSLSTSVAAGTETANALTDSRAVADAVGNSAAAGPVAGHKVDKKGPAITITVPAGNVYLLNQAVASAYTVTDGGSGVASSTPASGGALDTASVGAKTFAVAATDNVGNQSNTSAGYTVGYGLVALYDQTRSVKRGATIPIKVRLVDANGVNVSSPGIVLSAVKLVLVGGGASDAIVSDQNNANSDGNFRYDASLGGYIFNLSTKNMGLIDGTWRLYFNAAGDPVQHSVHFGVVR